MKMMLPNPDVRPSVQEILDKFLLSDSELESVFLKKNIKNLRDKISTYETKLKIRRKNSF